MCGGLSLLRQVLLICAVVVVVRFITCALCESSNSALPCQLALCSSGQATSGGGCCVCEGIGCMGPCSAVESCAEGEGCGVVATFNKDSPLIPATIQMGCQEAALPRCRYTQFQDGIVAKEVVSCGCSDPRCNVAGLAMLINGSSPRVPLCLHVAKDVVAC
eukprot:Sspe_Gene.116938::Locus_107133_Transcript_1_1_Confidence_1.000_Length_566::g.116938::m.116938